METILERLERIETRQAIEALNSDFCHFLDSNMIEELIDLFTEDAIYSHGLRMSHGVSEIRKVFAGRTADGVRTSRHMQTGLRISLGEPNKAKGKSVCATFAFDGPSPITPATPYLVADFVDEYRFCADGRWRISKRHIERIFTDYSNNGPEGLEQRS